MPEKLSANQEQVTPLPTLHAKAITVKMDCGDFRVCTPHIVKHWGQVLPDCRWAL